jgi:hypothetical protein
VPNLRFFFAACEQLGACVNEGSKVVAVHHDTCVAQQLRHSVVGKHRQHMHVMERSEALATETQRTTIHEVNQYRKCIQRGT